MLVPPEGLLGPRVLGWEPGPGARREPLTWAPAAHLPRQRRQTPGRPPRRAPPSDNRRWLRTARTGTVGILQFGVPSTRQPCAGPELQPILSPPPPSAVPRCEGPSVQCPCICLSVFPSGPSSGPHCGTLGSEPSMLSSAPLTKPPSGGAGRAQGIRDRQRTMGLGLQGL